MRGDSVLTSIVLLCLAVPFAGCSDGTSASAGASTRGRTATDAERLLVVRFDFDGDGFDDVLTLDVARAPYRVVEAIRGRQQGVFEDVTERWAGRGIDASLQEALGAYLERSFAVATETTLEVVSNGQPILVSVIE